MSRPLKLLRWLLDEFVAAIFVVVILSLLWVLVVREHMLPVSRGETGVYGQIEIPNTLTLDTKVTGFEIRIAPGRVVDIKGSPVLPLPDMLYADVRYTDKHGLPRTWEGSFFIGCDGEANCLTIGALHGVVLVGRARNGGTEHLAVRLLRPWQPASNIPPPTLPAPKESPKSSPPPQPLQTT